MTSEKISFYSANYTPILQFRQLNYQLSPIFLSVRNPARRTFGGLAMLHQIDQIILIKKFIYCFELHKMLQNLRANPLIDQFSEEVL